MQTAIIVSKKDPAGLNIKRALLKLFPFEEIDEKFDGNEVYQLKTTKLYIVEEASIYCEDLDKKIKADFFLFATKHKAESKIPSLSVHTQGNWAKAEFGGRDSQLCIAPASYLKMALLKLDGLAKGTKFEIIQECTHHGPYLEKPTMFIEIGSSEEQWEDEQAAEIIAETIEHLLNNKPPKYRIAFGIGGLHHTPTFKKVMLNTDIAFGHVCPKYNLENLNKEMIKQALERTMEKVDLVVLDWKGLGQYKEKVTSLLKELNLSYKKTKELY